MKVLIVDDHVLIRTGLKSLLLSYNPKWEVYEASNGIQAIIQAPKINPDIVLMDYSMPKLDGQKASRQLMNDIPGLKIIIISGFISSDNIRMLLDTGVQGIVAKSAGAEEILEAIYHVLRGKQHLTVESSINVPDEDLCNSNRGKKKKNRRSSLLTPRELEVMQLIVAGNRSDMITEKLAISVRTLNTHKANIFKKCNIHSTPELVRYAYKNNLA